MLPRSFWFLGFVARRFFGEPTKKRARSRWSGPPPEEPHEKKVRACRCADRCKAVFWRGCRGAIAAERRRFVGAPSPAGPEFGRQRDRDPRRARDGFKSDA